MEIAIAIAKVVVILMDLAKQFGKPVTVAEITSETEKRIADLKLREKTQREKDANDFIKKEGE